MVFRYCGKSITLLTDELTQAIREVDYIIAKNGLYNLDCDFYIDDFPYKLKPKDYYK